MYGSRTIADFASFLPWARKILAALEEILAEGGRSERIDFATYEEFAGLGDYHRSYKEFILKIPDLMADLERRLAGRRQATRGMATRRVADLAETGDLAIPPARHWIFSGFNAMNACEKKLFSFFQEKHGADLILRTDFPGLDDPQSPFQLQAETIRGLGMTPPAAAALRSGAWDDLADKVTIHPCDGVEGEIYQAFRILEEICRGRDEASLRKVAVLLPSAPSLIPFVQGAVSRFDQDAYKLPFNITLGYPLERTPMMQLIDSLLTILENTDGGTMAAGDYLRLIRHPYVKISGGGGDLEPLKRGIHLLENIIDGGNLTRVSIAGLEAKLAAELRRPAHGIAPGVAAEIAAQVGRPAPALHPSGDRGACRRSSPSCSRRWRAWAAKRTAAATCSSTSMPPPPWTRWRRLEDFTSSHDNAFQGADAAGLAATVRSHFRGRTIRFEGSPLQGVQVMGPLEFRGLSFDEIVILDALEGVLPGTTEVRPHPARGYPRHLRHPRSRRLGKRYTPSTFSPCSGRPSASMSCIPRKSEDGQECERSRFIERIVYAAEKKNEKAPTADPAVPALRRSGRASSGP